MHENNNTVARLGSRVGFLWAAGSALALQLGACTESKCPHGAEERDGVCVSEEGSLRIADGGVEDGGFGGDGRDGGAGDARGNFGDIDAESSAAPLDAGGDADASVHDPCEDAGCAETAICTVENGVALCNCTEGYEGDGVVCKRNLCIPLDDEDSFCGQHATCTPGASGDDDVTCTCEVGFGDCDDGDAAGVAGCETDLNTQQDCGACGATCAGTLQCVVGTCEQKVSRLVAGGEATCALMTPSAVDAGHSVRCWGRNQPNGAGDFRVLGDASFSEKQSLVPHSVPSLLARGLSLGGGHACALLADKGSTVTCWGLNASGQLGTGDTVVPGDRVERNFAGIVTQVVAGFRSTCALVNGAVECWGDWLALAGTADNDRPTPGPIPLPSGAGAVTELRAASTMNCARTISGKVFCWQQQQPVQVQLTDGTPLQDAVQLATGSDPHAGTYWESLACALRASGQVACWGIRSPDDASAPEPPGVLDANDPTRAMNVPMPAGVTQIAVGVAHVCALLSSGQIACLGAKPSEGALGFASELASISVATVVPGINDAVEVVAGAWHTCARRASGQVQCWGRNAQGEVGDGTKTKRVTPSNVVGLP